MRRIPCAQSCAQRRVHRLLAGLSVALTLVGGIAGESSSSDQRAAAPPGSPAAEPRDQSADAPRGRDDAAESSRQVRLFDFAERSLGNYEQTPMYWRQFGGADLPHYSTGRFDDDTGHEAPPSFRFALRGGNIGYEYRGDDIEIVPESDYLVAAYVRARGLVHARAFLASYLVDAAGSRIPGSDRVSNLVASIRPSRPAGPATGRSPATSPAAPEGAATDDEPWQRVEISFPGDFPDARTLRLQLWVMQAHRWRALPERTIDPILRQDVSAEVWFDDLAVYRLPHVRLRLSNAAGLIAPGHSESFEIDAHNATRVGLQAELAVRAPDGTEQYRQDIAVAPVTTARLSIPVPPLPPEVYTAELKLVSTRDTLMHREIRFAVLPALGAAPPRRSDVGIDVGPWGGPDPQGLYETITNLGCGAVKIGLPVGGGTADEPGPKLGTLRDLLRLLALAQIDATGVIVAPDSAFSARGGTTLHRLTHADDTWSDRFSPTLAFLGGLVPTWQLGAEALEAREPPGWDFDSIEQVRARLDRVVTMPELVVARSVYDAAPSAPDDAGPAPVDPARTGPRVAGTAAVNSAARLIHSFWIPAELPTRALPWQLLFVPQLDARRRADLSDAKEIWLALEPPPPDNLPRAQRLIETARRFLLAKAANAQRVYTTAPAELSAGGGAPAWQPTDEYIVLRTLFQHLVGKRAIGSMTFGNDGVGLLFSDGAASCLVVWSWRAEPGDATAELFLGPAAAAVDLAGAPVALETVDARTHVPLQPAPLIIRDVSAALVLLQAGFRIAPTFVQLHQREPRPVLTLRNTYERAVSGTITLLAPPDWTLTPSAFEFSLPAGETLVRPLDVQLPPRAVASEQVVRVLVDLLTPDEAHLVFDTPFRIGLEDVVVEATVQWSGDDLLVEQSLRNLAATTASFAAFCQAPGRARAEREFLRIGPGETKVQWYRFPQARDLAGGQLHIGIREIRGRRAMEQLVEVPR